MNKKIIAIAIAAAMAAPVAMADIKVSGRMAGEFVDGDDARVMGDSGMARFYIDGKMGNAFAKMGYKSGFAGDLGAKADLREQYLGYDFGSYDIKAGRVAGVMYTLEGDKFKGTFVQMKKGRVSHNDGFVNASVQFTTKVAGGKLLVNFNPTENMTFDHDGDDNGMPGNTPSAEVPMNMGGNMGVSWKGKMGNVGIFAGFNNGQTSEDDTAADQSSMKIGASMKFGATLVTAMLSNIEANGGEADATLIMVNHGLGNGLSVDFGYGMTDGGTNTPTQTRLVVQKNISKGVKIFAGFTTTDPDDAAKETVTNTGAGMEIRF